MKNLEVGNLFMNQDGWEVLRANKEIKLSFTEFLLLRELMLNVGKVLTREHLIDSVRDGFKKFSRGKKEKDYAQNSNVIDVYISYLKKKIDRGHKNKLIHSVRHVGYKMQIKVKTSLWS